MNSRIKLDHYHLSDATLFFLPICCLYPLLLLIRKHHLVLQLPVDKDALLFAWLFMTLAEHQICTEVHLLGADYRLGVLVWELFLAQSMFFVSSRCLLPQFVGVSKTLFIRS